MNDDHDSEKSDPQPTYKVGYGRPPEDKQFKKGRSGNPRGRPKRTPSFATIIREELGSTIPLKGPHGPTKLPLSRAIVRRALIDAASGKHPAAVARGLRLLERYGPTEDERPWDLSVLDDEELDILEKLISKISGKGSAEDDERGVGANSAGVP
jgi:hypothetical protein